MLLNKQSFLAIDWNRSQTDHASAGCLHHWLCPGYEKMFTEISFCFFTKRNLCEEIIVVYTYFHAYVYLRFMHAVLGTHLSYLGCLSRTDLSERKEGAVALHLPIQHLIICSVAEQRGGGGGLCTCNFELKNKLVK